MVFISPVSGKYYIFSLKGFFKGINIDDDQCVASGGAIPGKQLIIKLNTDELQYHAQPHVQGCHCVWIKWETMVQWVRSPPTKSKISVYISQKHLLNLEVRVCLHRGFFSVHTEFFCHLSEMVLIRIQKPWLQSENPRQKFKGFT